MLTRSLMRLFVLCGLACTITFAAEPKLGLQVDGGGSVGGGEWFDLLVRIDPAGEAIVLDSLEIEPQGPEGVEFKRALIPPPEKDGKFRVPFTVRVPTRLPKGADLGGLDLGPGGGADLERPEYAVKVRVRGTFAGGSAFDLLSEAEPVRDDPVKHHVQAKASIKTRPVVAGKANAVVLYLEVQEPGYWVYGEAGKRIGFPMQARLVPAFGAKPERLWNGGGPVTPPAKKYKQGHPFQLVIPFVPLHAGPLSMRVALQWAACNKDLCDPVEVAYVPIDLEVQPGSGTIDRIAPPAPASDSDDLAHKSLLQLLILAIGGGLFALAMPCTYPLIPITISFFTKQAEQRDGKLAGLATAYGLGIVSVFVLVGVVFGQPIVDFANLWWVNAVFALLFLVFGLSLVGLFQIELPGFFNDVAMKASGTGGYLSVFAMGTTLVITSFTCTAPVVGLVLVLAAKGGSLWRVGYTMGIFGLTMAIPFVVLSLSPKAMQSMPRSGVWMKTLKVTLGIVELGLVLKFLSNMDLGLGTNLIGRELFLVLWGLSFLAAALYLLGVLDLFRKGARWSVGKGRAACGILLLAVTAYLARGVNGTLLYENLEAFLPTLPDRLQEYRKGFLASVEDDYAKGIAKAEALNAPVLIHFTGYL